jgi:hypothetical protein
MAHTRAVTHRTTGQRRTPAVVARPDTPGASTRSGRPRHRWRRGAATAAAVTAAAALVGVSTGFAPPAAAEIGWTEPAILDTAEPTTMRLATAVDGTVVAAWIVEGFAADALRAAVRMPGQLAWSPTVTVAANLAAGARIDGLVSEGAGSATVAVVDGDGLAVHTRRSGAWVRSWGMADADGASLAVGPTGRVAVAVTRGSGATRSLVVRERPTPAGVWTAALVRAVGAGLGAPMVGLGTHPRLVVAWSQAVDAAGVLPAIHVRRRGASGAWSDVLRSDDVGYLGAIVGLSAGTAPDGTFSVLVLLASDTLIGFVEHLSPTNVWSTDVLASPSMTDSIATLRVSPLDGSAAWQWWGRGFDGAGPGTGITGRSGSGGSRWGPATFDVEDPPRAAALAPWRDGLVSLALVEPDGNLLVANGGAGSWNVGEPPQGRSEVVDAVDVAMSAAGVPTVLYTSRTEERSGPTLRASQYSMVDPVVLSPPRLTGGSTVGSRLTCAPGTWSEASSLAYRWYRNGVALSVTTPTYRLVAADRGTRIACGVLAANVAGTSFELSRTVTIK